MKVSGKGTGKVSGKIKVTYTIQKVTIKNPEEIKDLIKKQFVNLSILFIAIEDTFNMIITFDRHLSDDEEIRLYKITKSLIN